MRVPYFLRSLYFLLTVFLFPLGVANAEEAGVSAFGALNLLPQGAARRIAIIEGRDGAPIPERWYLVVYDPAQEHRLMEYVVAGGRVVAVRAVSQFAQELSPEDIIPVDRALINSDRVFQLVEQFARANNLKVPKINFRLKKEGAGSAPLWKITCLDDSASPFAGMIVAANTGTIIQTNGFNLSPTALSLNNANTPAPRSDLPQASPQEAHPSADSAVGADQKKKPGEQASSPQKHNRGKAESRRQTRPEPVAERREGLFGALRRLFRGPGY